MPLWIVFKFIRAARFPRFSMEAGETWTLGTVGGRASYLEARAAFDFAGGQCSRADVVELYRGDDSDEAQRIVFEAVMSGPDTMERRAWTRALGRAA